MRWPTVLSVLFHVALVVLLLVISFWKIEKLEARYVPTTFVDARTVAPAPPPPPPPPPAGGVKSSGKKQDKPRMPREIVQPLNVEKRVLEEERPGDEQGHPEGEVGGQEGGEVGGEIGGEIGGILGGVKNGTGNAPVTSAPEKPRIVPPVLIEGSRIAGNEKITLPESTKSIMGAQGIRTTQAVVKMCLSSGGAPTTIQIQKSTGFGEADQKIEREMKAWRYRPFLADGKPIPVCTSIVFRYVLR